MILVDSCVWIDALKNNNTKEVLCLQALVSRPTQEIGLSHVIYFEVLRGIPSDLERKRVQRWMDHFCFFDFLNRNFGELIQIYQLCRKKGFTLPKLGDWLILKTVLDHPVSLLTSDQDFHHLNKIYPFRLLDKAS